MDSVVSNWKIKLYNKLQKICQAYY